MSKEENLARVLKVGLVAVIRSSSHEHLLGVARALAEGGVCVVEITMTVPRALEVLQEVRRSLGDRVLVGAGTVLDAETARSAILAGAEFIVSPILNCDMIRMCRRHDTLVAPGAFTPTEVLTAWEHGADIVKVFPADVGGPDYLRALHGPLRQVRLMPTGGVNLNTAGDFLRAGACCLAVGGALVERAACEKGDFARIRTLAERFVGILREVRTGI